MITLTDDRGHTLLPEVHLIEPEPSSVALTNGQWGTAWQRMFDGDRLWVRLGGGRAVTWEWLLRQRNLVLVYDAPVRPDYDAPVRPNL